MAAVDKYKLDVEVTGLDKLSKLQNTLATIGFGAFIANAFRMADAMNDIADATGLTAGYVKGLGNAIQQAGGDMNDVGAIINKFYQNIDDLAQGSDKAAMAFGKIGIASQDLLTLSREDILGKTLQRLSEMGPSAQRTALGIELFGKAFGKIDPKKLDEILKTQNFAKLDAEIRKAGEAFGAMEDNILALQQATVTVFGQLIGKTDNLKLSAQEAEKIIRTLAVAFGLAFSLKTLAMIVQITKGLRDLGLTAALLSRNPVLLALATGAVALGGKMLFDYIQQGIDKVNASISDLDGVSMNTIKTYSDGIKELQKQLKAGVISQDEFNKKAEELAKGVKSGGSGPAATAIEATNREKAAKSIKLQTELLFKQLAIQNELARASNNLIGIESTRANLLTKINDLEAGFAQTSLDYAQKIQDEYNKGADSNSLLITYYREQLLIKRNQLEIDKQIAKEEYEKLKRQQKLNNAVQLYGTALDVLSDTVSFDKIIAGYQLTADAAAEYNKEIQEYDRLRGVVNNLVTEFAKLGNIDAFDVGKIAEIDEMVGDLGRSYESVLEKFSKDLIDAEQFRTMINTIQTEFADKIKTILGDVDDEQLKFFTKVMGLEMQRHLQRMDNIKKESEEENNKQENYALGAEQALEDISKQFTPFKMAQDAVLISFQKIGSAIDNFVETGKFKFKDFAASIIADLTKMILKALVFKYIFEPIMGALGLSIPGKASGGPVQKGQPYMVGEKGPELFVPPGAGTIVPNNKLGQSKGVSTGAVNAPVTNNYITNNISAMDAKSVAQLFAENRKTLLGTVRMAEKEMPYMGRA